METVNKTTSNRDARTSRALAEYKAEIRRYLQDNRNRYRSDSKVLQALRIPSALDGQSTAILNVIREEKRRSGYGI